MLSETSNPALRLCVTKVTTGYPQRRMAATSNTKQPGSIPPLARAIKTRNKKRKKKKPHRPRPPLLPPPPHTHTWLPGGCWRTSGRTPGWMKRGEPATRTPHRNRGILRQCCEHTLLSLWQVDKWIHRVPFLGGGGSFLNGTSRRDVDVRVDLAPDRPYVRDKYEIKRHHKTKEVARKKRVATDSCLRKNTPPCRVGINVDIGKQVTFVDKEPEPHVTMETTENEARSPWTP